VENVEVVDEQGSPMDRASLFAGGEDAAGEESDETGQESGAADAAVTVEVASSREE
jgi:hypothetical protein